MHSTQEVVGKSLGTQEWPGVGGGCGRRHQKEVCELLWGGMSPGVRVGACSAESPFPPWNDHKAEEQNVVCFSVAIVGQSPCLVICG